MSPLGDLGTIQSNLTLTRQDFKSPDYAKVTNLFRVITVQKNLIEEVIYHSHTQHLTKKLNLQSMHQSLSCLSQTFRGKLRYLTSNEA